MFLPTKAVLALFATTLAASCGQVHHHHDQVFDPYIYEAEPNDFAFSAQGIGPIHVGESFLIRGHTNDHGTDPFDGFAFLADQPMDIEFSLQADDPGADFDVQLFDPYTGTTVASWETGWNPENGQFSVESSGMEFHLVVSSFHGSGNYTFEVRGRPLTWLGASAGLPLRAQGSAVRPEGAVDWSAYEGRKNVPETLQEVPSLRVTTVTIDPETGRTKVVEIRRFSSLEALQSDL
ncbi:MAG TPA: hypothetical protein VK843_01235 [Planctomycetota bacterium]|nr:hypothetical protein [Planctomycetota bacterium]